MNKYIFSIIGGDKRNINLVKFLKEDGHLVKLYGFSNYDEEKPADNLNLYDTIEDSHYIIGGTPLTNDNITFTAPFEESSIRIKDVFDLMNKNQILIGGFISKEIMNLANERDIKILDILEREELSLLNAIPTAEGAIKIAIEETDITLNGSNIMIIGYGRIGRILSKMLKGIGANIFVVVNKNHIASEARGYGYVPTMYDNMNEKLSYMDIIFNTVDKTVLDNNNVRYLNKDCLVIDLASPPFGVDYNACKENNIKALWARSLPGRVAPKTTAMYIKETLYNVIEEFGRQKQ